MTSPMILLNSIKRNYLTFLLATFAMIAVGAQAYAGVPQMNIVLDTAHTHSLNRDTIIYTQSHVANHSVGTVKDGSSYLGLVSGTDFLTNWHVVWYPSPEGDHLKEVKWTASGIGPNGPVSQVLDDMHWDNPSAIDWHEEFRISTTAFKNLTKITLVSDTTTFNSSHVVEQKWSWLVYNNFFAGGNRDFDGDAPDSDFTQESELDNLDVIMQGINHAVAWSVTDNKVAIESQLTSSTVFYMSTHGQINQFGDCLATPDSSDADYLFPPDINDAEQAKGVSFPNINFAFIDACLSFSNNNVALGILTGEAPRGSVPGPGTDRATLGYPVEVDSNSDESNFAIDLFDSLASGYTLHKAVTDSYHRYPVIHTEYGPLLGVYPITHNYIYPVVHGDLMFGLHGVYQGYQSPDIWWKLLYHHE